MEQKVAIYMRSSLEQDENLRNAKNPDESDTIANQRKYLYENALAKGFRKEQIVEYVDDGHTGTNFRRPAFERMIVDIEAGKIQTVMVKDFSRLGRDYIGVGEYVEQYFPLHNVRIISVNDNWDSDEHIGETLELDASFRTIIYEMYSRDLSVKRKSANKARNNNGTFIGAYVPYGYKKIPGDAHSIVIDEECAPVVRRVFTLYNSGEKIGNIAKILTDEGIPTPAMAKGDSHCYDKVVIDRGIWSNNIVGRILKNEMYTGTLILNRWAVKEFKADVCVENDPSEWLKFPNNHEAIISCEEYEKAKKRLSKRPRGGESKGKRIYPLYCGHCGGKFHITTRNEDTFTCDHGSRIPADACGQIEIRRDKLEEILLKAINTQAKVLLDQSKKTKLPGKDERTIEKQINRLSAEKQTYRDKRMELYKQYRAGQIEKDSFLQQKTAVLKQEEKCLSELEAAQAKLDGIQREHDFHEEHADKYREYALLKNYDHDIVNSLISKVEAFNDGHIKIHWNFESEFGKKNETAAAVEAETVTSEPDGRKLKVAIYTSDMFLVPTDEEDDSASVRESLCKYAEEALGVCGSDVSFFYDSKEDDSLYFREGYMKYIDAARVGRANILLIRSFRDLYLSNQQMNDLMFWILPKLNCRLIAVDDGFDTGTAADMDYREMFEKYKGVRNGDLTRYRAIERKAGIRKPKQVIYCARLYGYYAGDDGCYAVPEVIAIVKIIFRMCKENHSLRQAVRWLNKEGVPTCQAFFIEHGRESKEEKHPKWTSEKVWGVIKQEGYVQHCRHYEKCMEMGRHCERIPIIDQETFDEVNHYCRYRNR